MMEEIQLTQSQLSRLDALEAFLRLYWIAQKEITWTRDNELREMAKRLTKDVA